MFPINDLLGVLFHNMFSAFSVCDTGLLVAYAVKAVTGEKNGFIIQ